ncbi:nucleotide-sugar transporter-domain-containing protein [Epithele typhae]|uniref:nucleotide-sugar transporter-domain-containing protein n=1 Tax=Epithele typhae TaxID=378194 RepID=UPI002008BA5C|nr:nucleotide-sugar transporter-domain-containing protein [Epithele typhae]KAH9946125.1 nucleotide-sugar transporter-domain-containing protein [Epithele typhae]
MSPRKDYAVLPQHVLDSDAPQDAPAVPSIFGLPLKYVSLVTLAVQNALLALIMHYSRVSTAPQHTYSAASAVLLTELLKGFISLTVAFVRLDYCSPAGVSTGSVWNPRVLFYRFRRLGKEVFRPDCWKLSIPAILYVIQNNLQFVAVSNLDAATFQVSYQMKILTTAAFSVLLLRKKLSPTKWFALLCLAIGAFKGFMAVVMAFYFEMVLKNSQTDLWVRNVQLSLFSLLPAIVPIVFSNAAPNGPTIGWLERLFANFGVWAWATVLIQVLGGLLTALVIKYADNILKGFATSLSIVISFLASVALFNLQMTVTFVLGSTVVLVATWMYNQPDAPQGDSFCSKESHSWGWRWRRAKPATSALELAGGAVAISRRPSTSSLASLDRAPASGQSRSYPGSPVEREMPSPRAASRLAHYFNRPGSGTFVIPDPATSFNASSSSTPLITFASSSPSTRPPSSLSSCASSRPASAMGSSTSTLAEQEHHP